MAKSNCEIETVIFQALSHPMRRTILTILDSSGNGLLYTDLINELELSTGKLNYHLEQLEGLIEKNKEHRYVLTSLGKKALNQLRQLKSEVTVEDEKYLKIAGNSQRASLEPTIKSFIVIGIMASIVVIAVLAVVSYVAITEAGTPVVVIALLPLLMAIQIAVTVTLVRALRSTPGWLRRIEKRFIET